MSVLLAIVAINVGVSLLGFRALRADRREAAERFLFVPSQVARGENGLGMLLSHVAHANWLHLGLNMFALWSFAGTVLRSVGPGHFLLIYAVAGLGSDLVVFALRKDDPTYRCLGASGSVVGIVMAAVVLDPSTSVVLMLVPIPIPGPVFMIGYALITAVLVAQNRRDGISHEGHLGGAIVGLGITVLLAPEGLRPLVHWFSTRF